MTSELYNSLIETLKADPKGLTEINNAIEKVTEGI
jgi:hypothetical protein